VLASQDGAPSGAISHEMGGLDFLGRFFLTVKHDSCYGVFEIIASPDGGRSLLARFGLQVSKMMIPVL
jgi:hypothetical protein